MRPYTTYLVTLYPLKVELRRRYSEFDTLRETLLRRYPALLINPLPPKKAVNNTSDETVQSRMKGKGNEVYNHTLITIMHAIIQ